MRYEKIALCFEIDQQIEIERIVTDKDKDSAFEFVDKLSKEFNKRSVSHCGVMLDWTPDKKVYPPEKE